MGKSCKKCKGGKKRMSRKSKVSGFDTAAAFDFDFMEIGELALGAVGVNLVANPIINAIWNTEKDPKKVRPDWATIVIKGAVALGLNSIDNRIAKNAAKGVVINIAHELINKHAPDAMKNKLQNLAGVGSYDDLEYIDLEGELAGVDSMLNEVAGMDEVASVSAGW